MQLTQLKHLTRAIHIKFRPGLLCLEHKESLFISEVILEIIIILKKQGAEFDPYSHTLWG